MSRNNIIANCLPSNEHLLLLHACLSTGAECLDAWEQWKTVFENGKLDKASRRLLPLLYRNLQNQGIDDALAIEFKQEYFHTWSQNQFAFRRIADLISEFNRAGIPNMALKGAALAVLYYEDAGLRPMADVDVLVRRDQAGQAIRLLNRLGWESTFSSPEALIPFEQATEFRDADNQHFDLHWGLLWEGRQDLGDEEFWKHSIATEINGVPTRSLEPADQLLHVCVHGAKWNDTASLRWVADAMMIIRSKKFGTGWIRLVQQAKSRQLTLPMSETLGYLDDLFDARIPAEVLSELRTAPTARSERFFYRVRLGSNDTLKTLPILWHWSNSIRINCEGPVQKRLIQFSKYLQSLWSVKRLWHIPFYLIAKPVKNIQRGFGLNLRKGV